MSGASFASGVKCEMAFGVLALLLFLAAYTSVPHLPSAQCRVATLLWQLCVGGLGVYLSTESLLALLMGAPFPLDLASLAALNWVLLALQLVSGTTFGRKKDGRKKDGRKKDGRKKDGQKAGGGRKSPSGSKDGRKNDGPETTVKKASPLSLLQNMELPQIPMTPSAARSVHRQEIREVLRALVERGCNTANGFINMMRRNLKRSLELVTQQPPNPNPKDVLAIFVLVARNDPSNQGLGMEAIGFLEALATTSNLSFVSKHKEFLTDIVSMAIDDMTKEECKLNTIVAASAGILRAVCSTLPAPCDRELCDTVRFFYEKAHVRTRFRDNVGRFMDIWKALTVLFVPGKDHSAAVSDLVKAITHKGPEFTVDRGRYEHGIRSLEAGYGPTPVRGADDEPLDLVPTMKSLASYSLQVPGLPKHLELALSALINFADNHENLIKMGKVVNIQFLEAWLYLFEGNGKKMKFSTPPACKEVDPFIKILEELSEASQGLSKNYITATLRDFASRFSRAFRALLAEVALMKSNTQTGLLPIACEKLFSEKEVSIANREAINKYLIHAWITNTNPLGFQLGNRVYYMHDLPDFSGLIDEWREALDEGALKALNIELAEVQAKKPKKIPHPTEVCETWMTVSAYQSIFPTPPLSCFAADAPADSGPCSPDCLENYLHEVSFPKPGENLPQDANNFWLRITGNKTMKVGMEDHDTIRKVWFAFTAAYLRFLSMKQKLEALKTERAILDLNSLVDLLKTCEYMFLICKKGLKTVKMISKNINKALSTDSPFLAEAERIRQNVASEKLKKAENKFARNHAAVEKKIKEIERCETDLTTPATTDHQAFLSVVDKIQDTLERFTYFAENSPLAHYETSSRAIIETEKKVILDKIRRAQMFRPDTNKLSDMTQSPRLKVMTAVLVTITSELHCVFNEESVCPANLEAEKFVPNRVKPVIREQMEKLKTEFAAMKESAFCKKRGLYERETFFKVLRTAISVLGTILYRGLKKDLTYTTEDVTVDGVEGDDEDFTVGGCFPITDQQLASEFGRTLISCKEYVSMSSSGFLLPPSLLFTVWRNVTGKNVTPVTSATLHGLSIKPLATDDTTPPRVTTWIDGVLKQLLTNCSEDLVPARDPKLNSIPSRFLSFTIAGNITEVEGVRCRDHHSLVVFPTKKEGKNGVVFMCPSRAVMALVPAGHQHGLNPDAPPEAPSDAPVDGTCEEETYGDLKCRHTYSCRLAGKGRCVKVTPTLCPDGDRFVTKGVFLPAMRGVRGKDRRKKTIHGQSTPCCGGIRAYGDPESSNINRVLKRKGCFGQCDAPICFSGQEVKLSESSTMIHHFTPSTFVDVKLDWMTSAEKYRLFIRALKEKIKIGEFGKPLSAEETSCLVEFSDNFIPSDVLTCPLSPTVIGSGMTADKLRLSETYYNAALERAATLTCPEVQEVFEAYNQIVASIPAAGGSFVLRRIHRAVSRMFMSISGSKSVEDLSQCHKVLLVASIYDLLRKLAESCPQNGELLDSLNGDKTAAEFEKDLYGGQQNHMTFLRLIVRLSGEVFQPPCRAICSNTKCSGRWNETAEIAPQCLLCRTNILPTQIPDRKPPWWVLFADIGEKIKAPESIQVATDNFCVTPEFVRLALKENPVVHAILTEEKIEKVTQRFSLAIHAAGVNPLSALCGGIMQLDGSKKPFTRVDEDSILQIILRSPVGRDTITLTEAHIKALAALGIQTDDWDAEAKNLGFQICPVSTRVFLARLSLTHTINPSDFYKLTRVIEAAQCMWRAIWIKPNDFVSRANNLLDSISKLPADLETFYKSKGGLVCPSLVTGGCWTLSEAENSAKAMSFELVCELFNPLICLETPAPPDNLEKLLWLTKRSDRKGIPHDMTTEGICTLLTTGLKEFVGDVVVKTTRVASSEVKELQSAAKSSGLYPELYKSLALGGLTWVIAKLAKPPKVPYWIQVRNNKKLCAEMPPGKAKNVLGETVKKQDSALEFVDDLYDTRNVLHKRYQVFLLKTKRGEPYLAKLPELVPPLPVVHKQDYYDKLLSGEYSRDIVHKRLEEMDTWLSACERIDNGNTSFRVLVQSISAISKKPKDEIANDVLYERKSAPDGAVANEEMITKAIETLTSHWTPTISWVEAVNKILPHLGTLDHDEEGARVRELIELFAGVQKIPLPLPVDHTHKFCPVSWKAMFDVCCLLDQPDHHVEFTAYIEEHSPQVLGQFKDYSSWNKDVLTRLVDGYNATLFNPVRQAKISTHLRAGKVREIVKELEMEAAKLMSRTKMYVVEERPDTTSLSKHDRRALEKVERERQKKIEQAAAKGLEVDMTAFVDFFLTHHSFTSNLTGVSKKKLKTVLIHVTMDTISMVIASLLTDLGADEEPSRWMTAKGLWVDFFKALMVSSQAGKAKVFTKTKRQNRFDALACDEDLSGESVVPTPPADLKKRGDDAGAAGVVLDDADTTIKPSFLKKDSIHGPDAEAPNPRQDRRKKKGKKKDVSQEARASFQDEAKGLTKADKAELFRLKMEGQGHLAKARKGNRSDSKKAGKGGKAGREPRV